MLVICFFIFFCTAFQLGSGQFLDGFGPQEYKDKVKNPPSTNIDPINNVIHLETNPFKNVAKGNPPDTQSGKAENDKELNNKTVEKHQPLEHTVDAKSDQKDSNISSVLPKSGKSDIVQSGALLRGFYVFFGLSVLMVFYFVFRSYKLRRGSQPANVVRKYGIIARRSDIEMRPLDLDEDEDETIFEIGSKNGS